MIYTNEQVASRSAERLRPRAKQADVAASPSSSRRWRPEPSQRMPRPATDRDPEGRADVRVAGRRRRGLGETPVGARRVDARAERTGSPARQTPSIEAACGQLSPPPPPQKRNREAYPAGRCILTRHRVARRPERLKCAKHVSTGGLQRTAPRITLQFVGPTVAIQNTTLVGISPNKSFPSCAIQTPGISCSNFSWLAAFSRSSGGFSE